jgi:hypothetical protein
MRLAKWPGECVSIKNAKISVNLVEMLNADAVKRPSRRREVCNLAVALLPVISSLFYDPDNYHPRYLAA